MSKAEQIERMLHELCTDCEAECEKNGKVPECWGQYGNPCEKCLEGMSRLYEEVRNEQLL